METLVTTNKHLTLEAVTDEIDLSNECVSRCYLRFVRWVIKAHLTDTIIRLAKDTIFWDEWLKNNREAQDWLVVHKFAEWEKPVFEPFDLRIETLDEAEMLWNELDGYKINGHNINHRGPLHIIWLRLGNIMKERR